MAKTKTRIRCLFCGNLVSRKYSTHLPYAIKSLTIDNKRGCICSACINDFYAKYNNDEKNIGNGLGSYGVDGDFYRSEGTGKIA